MQLSKLTSNLLSKRLQTVKNRILKLEDAIKNKNFDIFAQICMKDSNEFHSICSNTYPPIFYLNDTSKLIIKLCHIINKQFEKISNNKNKCIVCYTFDAGPNAVLIILNEFYF